MRDEILRVENVILEIDGICYLDNILLNIFKAEIVGLIPLDNHGKSYFIELILQNIPINFGRVYFNHELVNYYEHSNMTRNAAYVVEKETKLIRDLKVADNIWVLNRAYRELNEINTLLEKLGIIIDLDQYVSELGFLETAIVELIRAVISGAKLVILDELSSFLSIEELTFFQKLLLHYVRDGISFLYIANHHEAAFEICERVALFDKGRIIKVIQAKDYSENTLAPYLLPYTHQTVVYEQNNHDGVLQCFDLCTDNLNAINFSVQQGECLTILDLNNRGIQEIGAIITGVLRPSSGSFVMDKKEISLRARRSLVLDGVAYIPENPTQESLFYHATYLENLTFLLDRKLRRSVISPRALRYIKEEFQALAGDDIDATDLWGLDMSSLYSLVYFRFLLYKPKVVVIMQPFAHADMYLRARITELINMLKQSGVSVIILAVSLSDTLTVTDRLLIMEAGKLVDSPPV